MKKIKVLLDTDIGGDIDDTICLSYLLAQPKCDLVGITTVMGDTVKQASLASVICKIAGKKIPIVPGARIPLLGKSTYGVPEQARFLKDWKHDTKFPDITAVEFMRQTIRKNPGEITLLTIGPLTNAALLFAVDPEIPKLLKGLVMMAGSYTPAMQKKCPTEWNAKVDPYATAMVFNAPVKNVLGVGVDVTTKVCFHHKEFLDKCDHPLLKPMHQFGKLWFKKWPYFCMHDPLAMMLIFEPRLCTYKKGTVEVELKDPELMGRTIWKPRAAKPRHRIAVTVNRDLFWKKFFSVF